MRLIRVLLVLFLLSIGNWAYSNKSASNSEAEIESLKDKLGSSYGVHMDSIDQWTYRLIQLAHEINDWESVITGYRYKAVFASENDNIKEAIDNFQHAYELLSLYPAGEELFNYHYYISFLYSSMGENDKAFESMLAAEKWCLDNKRPELLIRVYNDLIYWYSDVDFDRGLEYAEKVEKLLATTDYDYHIFGATQFKYSFGRLYLENKKYDKAIEYLSISEKMCDSLEWKACQINALMDLGRSYQYIGKLDIAEKHLNKALALFKEYPSARREAKVHGTMGDFYSHKQDWNQAIKSYHKAIDRSSSIRHVKSGLKFYQGLSKAYEEIGQLEDAIYWISKRDSLRSKINSSEQEARIAMLENEQKLDQLIKNKELEKQSTRHQYWAIIGFSLLLVLLIAVLIKFQQNVLKRKDVEHSILIKQQEELGSKLETKSKELVIKLIYLQKKNKLIDKSTQELLKVKMRQERKSDQRKIQEIIDGLSTNKQDDLWKEFEKHFEEVYQTFYSSLNKAHPELSASDKKLCTFLKLNLSSKEIANITLQSVSSIDTARARLRKKLGLAERSDCLVSYLAQF